MAVDEVFPMVKDKTRTESMNVETVCSRIESKKIVIPDYQRDSDQWDNRKKSLFVESILNNLTVPAFFFFSEKIEGRDVETVVDGQQRLTTITSFKRGEFKLNEADEADYIDPAISHVYAGKHYSDLPVSWQDNFNDYPLSIINLPTNLDLSSRLEIFRRINEGGTPLSAQDIRLAYYSESVDVYFVKMIGIYSEDLSRENISRVITAGEKKGLEFPWCKEGRESIYAEWCSWWKGTKTALGQTPSEMFTWFLMAVYADVFDGILKNPAHLGLTFKGSTNNAFDLFFAQVRFEEMEPERKTLGVNLIKLFDFFEIAIGFALGGKLVGVDAQNYKAFALVIGALYKLGVDMGTISNYQYRLLSKFISKPRATVKDPLIAIEYPEPKGKWAGQKGQFAQISACKNIVAKILSLHEDEGDTSLV